MNSAARKALQGVLELDLLETIPDEQATLNPKPLNP